MKLVMLTNSYPYGNQEAFIEPEMRSLEKSFDSILILTLAAPESAITRYIPDNAKVILVREKTNSFLGTVIHMMKPSTWKEICFATKTYHYPLKTSLALMIRFYGPMRRFFMRYLEDEDRNNTVFYSYWLSHLAYALACFKKKHNDAFCISRAHGFDVFVDFKSVLYRREIITALDGVFPISADGLYEIEKRIIPLVGEHHAEIKVFHLGVDYKDVKNPDKEHEEMHIVSCSFITGIKRLDILVEALSKVDDITISWVHFGGGQDEPKLKELAHTLLGNKTNITYRFVGQTAHEKIMQYYKCNHIDLFVNCSDHEGIPVSIMEAMANGILCVARDVGGNRELIKNSYNGFLLNSEADSNNYTQLFNNLYQMDEKTLTMMRQNAMNTITEEYSSAKVYDLFVDYVLKKRQLT